MHVRRTLLFAALAFASSRLGAQPVQAPAAVEQPFLGLQTELKDAADEKGGVVVAYVWPQSAAKEMGFKLGDEIRTLNDVFITDPQSFAKEVKKENVNAKLRFRVIRAGAELKIEGRMGSHEKTMKAYQEQVRKDLVGKPLPPLPGLTWWSPATKTWGEDPKALEKLKGKIGVLISFDDCPQCKPRRYERLNQMQAMLAKTPAGEHVAYAGIFFDERAGKAASLKRAGDLVSSQPPTVPIAVAFYPNDKPAPSDRDVQVLIHNHGAVIVSPSGLVDFVQVQGFPEQEFGAAFQKALLALEQKPAPPKSP